MSLLVQVPTAIDDTVPTFYYEKFQKHRLKE